MMKSLFKYIIPAILGLAVMSCTQTHAPEGCGYVEIHAVTDRSTYDVTIDSFQGTVTTKADGSEVIALTIYDAADQVVFSTDDCSSVSGPISLETGSYRAVATCGLSLEGASAAFDSPFYCASSDFTVYRGTVQSLDLVLTLELVKVTVEFSQEIIDNFSAIDLTVSNSSLESAGSLLFSNAAPEAGNTLSKTGYFTPTGTLAYSLSLTSVDGRVFQPFVQTYSGVSKKQHYAFKFGMAGQQPEGGSEITITVDDSMTRKEHDILLDFTIQDIPEFQAAFDYNSTLSYYAGDNFDGSLAIDFKKPATALLLSHSDASLSEAGLPQSTELVGASDGTVSTLAAMGIATQAVTSQMTSVTIDFSQFFASLPAGTYSFGIFVQNEAGGEATCTINVQVLPRTAAVSCNAWARFATLTGSWLTSEQPEGLGFQIRTGDGEWTDVNAAISVDAASKTFTADAKGLQSATAYEFRTVCAAETLTQAISFTTEAEEVIPNMSFDSWYQSDGAWYPNADANNFYWDTANGGTKTLSIYPTTPAEDEFIYAKGDGKNAAKLESKSAALVGIAAGNIYTGKFVKAVISLSNPGAELDWGIPFTSRPLAMKGYYHYLPATVNQGSYNDMSGKTDIGQIQIILTDWDSPFRINTQTKTFVDVSENNTSIIGYGTIDLNQTSEYTGFTVEVDWRDTTRKPTYIVVVAAASKYGDYFTGGVGSTLYLDEFSFVYDPDQI